MTRLKYRGLFVLALCVTAAGCGRETLPIAPTVPEPITVTERFTGTLTVNGAVPYPFRATSAGAVTLTVMSLEDSSGPAEVGVGGTIRIGLALGTWNGTACSFTVPTLTNDNAFVATAVTGVVTSGGTLCARVYDAGKLTEPATFDIQITHP